MCLYRIMSHSSLYRLGAAGIGITAPQMKVPTCPQPLLDCKSLSPCRPMVVVVTCLFDRLHKHNVYIIFVLGPKPPHTNSIKPSLWNCIALSVVFFSSTQVQQDGKSPALILLFLTKRAAVGCDIGCD